MNFLKIWRKFAKGCLFLVFYDKIIQVTFWQTLYVCVGGQNRYGKEGQAGYHDIEIDTVLANKLESVRIQNAERHRFGRMYSFFYDCRNLRLYRNLCIYLY